MMFTNLSGKRVRSALTESNDMKGVIGSEVCISYISLLQGVQPVLDTPYNFNQNSDRITSNLLMEGREKQRRIARDKLILKEVFG